MRTNEELVKLYQEGNKQAMDELLENNRGIIAKLSNKYLRVNSKLEFDELFNSGVIGFIKAAQKYDFNNEKKASFTTYAIHFINRCILICVNGHSSKEIENNKFYNATTSLNAPIGESGDIELMETIEGVDYSFENIDYQLYLKQLRRELEQVMNEYLTLKQREILKFRYGWDVAPMSLRDIGDILGLSGARVRQTEVKALRVIRNSKWAKTTGREFARELIGYRDLNYRTAEKKIDFNRYFE